MARTKKIKLPVMKTPKLLKTKTPRIITDSTDMLVKNLQKSLRKIPGGTYKY